MLHDEEMIDFVPGKTKNAIYHLEEIHRDGNVYWRPGSIWGHFYALSYSISMKTPQQSTSCHHLFTDEESEVQRDQITCVKLYCLLVLESKSI